MTTRKWILLAEDNAYDADQTVRALAASYTPPPVVVVRDGVEALNCLYRRNGFKSRPAGDPAVVLLDLNMPNVDGWEVLRQVKSDAQMKAVPIVVFTSSRGPGDLARSYQLGANAYVVKSSNFRQLAAALEGIREFWIAVNEPPPETSGNKNADPAPLAAAA